MHLRLIVLGLLSSATVLAQDAPSPLPDGVSERRVEIWSEGTRMIGDLYEPTELEAGAQVMVRSRYGNRYTRLAWISGAISSRGCYH